MGQYYYVVNVTKKQYLHPHKFGEGIKLLARSIHMPPVLVLEALELLESRGLAKSKTTVDGETSWDVSKPKTEKKPVPKKAKKTSEVRA